MFWKHLEAKLRKKSIFSDIFLTIREELKTLLTGSRCQEGGSGAMRWISAKIIPSSFFISTSFTSLDPKFQWIGSLISCHPNFLKRAWLTFISFTLIFKSKIPDYIFNQNKIGFDAPLKNWRKLNAKYFIENDINEFLYKNMQINKLKKNINNENFTQLTYSLNCYNKWLNSKNVLLSNNTNI